MGFDDSPQTWERLRDDIRAIFRDCAMCASRMPGRPGVGDFGHVPAIGYAGSKDVVYSMGCVGTGSPPPT